MIYSPLEQFEILYIFMPNTTCFSMSDEIGLEPINFSNFEKLLSDAFFFMDSEVLDYNACNDCIDIEEDFPDIIDSLKFIESVIFSNEEALGFFLFDNFFFDILSNVNDLNEIYNLKHALQVYGKHLMKNEEMSKLFFNNFNVSPQVFFFDETTGICSFLDEYTDDLFIINASNNVSDSNFAVIMSFFHFFTILEETIKYQSNGWTTELSYEDNLLAFCNSIFFQEEPNEEKLFFLMADIAFFSSGSIDDLVADSGSIIFEFMFEILLYDPNNDNSSDYYDYDDQISLFFNNTNSGSVKLYIDNVLMQRPPLTFCDEVNKTLQTYQNDAQADVWVWLDFLSDLILEDYLTEIELIDIAIDEIDITALDVIEFFNMFVDLDDFNSTELNNSWNYEIVQELNLLFLDLLINVSDLEDSDSIVTSVLYSNKFSKVVKTSFDLLNMSFSLDFVNSSIIFLQIKLIIISLVHPFLILISYFSTNLFITLLLLLFLIILMFLVYSFQFFLIPRNAHLFMLYYYSFIKSIIVDLIAHQTGKKYYFQLIAFLFILLNLLNLYGLVPYTFVLTSQFSFTFFCSFIFFTALNFTGITVHGLILFSLFFPSGAPIFIAPLLVVIEFISYFARVFSLAIRLFANITAGHILLKILSWFTWSMMDVLFASILSTLIITVLWVLEFFISVLQAYVFTILICIYLNDVLNLH